MTIRDVIDSPARAEQSHRPGLRTTGSWALVALAGIVGVTLAASSQVASAAVVGPAEPRPSASPRLSAAEQAELMSDVLPASPPIALTAPVTDAAGVLSDAERRDVLAALERLADASDLRMFVAYIETFDGTEPEDWANASANQSGLGSEDLLVAIATVDGRFGVSADSNVVLTDDQLDAVDDAVAVAVADEKWAPAATGAADTVRRATTDAAPNALLVTGIVVGALLLLTALAYVVWRFALPRFFPRLPRLAHLPRLPQIPRLQVDGLSRLSQLAARGLPTRSGEPAPSDDLSVDELEERAASALVGIDDALKTCEQELGFARAELGTDATRDFEQSLARAAGDVREAFAIRQELDAAEQLRQQAAEPSDGGEVPEPDDTERRARLRHLVALCDGAADTLDARTRAFDDLRRLQQRAPEVLAAVVARQPEVGGRVAAARSTLDRLSDTYPAAALATVSGNPEQAELLLANTKEAVAAGHSALAVGQKAVAVAHARGAQNALGQAVMLLDAVDTAAANLADAAGRLDRSVESLAQDVTSARAVEGDLRITLARTAAQAALKHVEVTREGGDPFAGLQRIAASEAALDAALSRTRDATEVDARASALLRDTLERVDAQLRQTADFVATRRGAVGATARTRLAEADRLADAARTLQQNTPRAALTKAQRASTLVQEATSLARSDADAAVLAAPKDTEPEAAGADGSDANGPITGGMMLGGILLDPHLVRSRRRARTARIGGGFGGGGFGGGRPSGLRTLGVDRAWWPASAK